MKTAIHLATIVATGTAVAAFAHSGATGVVKERMDAMKAMAEAVEAVSPMMRGEAEYDPEAMRAAARTFQAHSGDAMTELFPEGSTDAPSEVKPDIWSDWDRFTALAEQLGVHAEGLEAAAENGLAAGGGRMGAGSMMGDSSGMGSGAMMGGSSMMGSGMMGNGTSGRMSADHIAAMPADAAFFMTTQVCSACHERFRAEDD